MIITKMTSFYAVAIGKQIGVYTSWKDCQQNVLHYPNAKFKKFDTQEEADVFIETYQQIEQPTKKKDTLKEKKSHVSETHYVYTDGACANNGKSNASAGAGVYFAEKDSRNLSVSIEGRQTNNVAEATAILLACQQISKEFAKYPNRKYVIVSDSNYAIQYATEWGEKQARLGWMKDIANKDLLKQLYSTASSIENISFLYIKAHTHLQDKHSLGNEQADILAYKGIPKMNGKAISGAVKVYLTVPYAKKDEAKAFGAKWDNIIKKWYTRKTHRHYSKLMSQFDSKPKV